MLGRTALIFEVVFLTLLILATRGANYQDVFVGGNIYFSDGDCYARMSRVRLCAQHPGLVVRHHEFENFPQGTTPHTTAPLDYLILGLATLLRPLTERPIDLAGALISPALALGGGLFLLAWSRRMRFRFRWAALGIYALSPVLVHGTELGRPDHQSLTIVLLLLALAAEWTLQGQQSRTWSVVSGIAWAMALWVSFYEPLLLFLLVNVMLFGRERFALFRGYRRRGWLFFGSLLFLALIIERRLPSFSIFSNDAFLRNWAATIGELAPLSWTSGLWLRWTGYMILIAPLLLWWHVVRPGQSVGPRPRRPFFLIAPLLFTFCLTMAQARWGYLFVLVFALALPTLLEINAPPFLVWIALVLSLFPILHDWDERIWPNDVELARRIENRRDAVDLRAIAIELISSQQQPFLAPWWLSPSIAYWSGQPGVAGTSHESLSGIIDTARFFLAKDPQSALGILRRRKAVWVFSYDSARVEMNSATLLGVDLPARPLIRVLDQSPTQAPPFIVLALQRPTAKLFRVPNNL